MVTIYFNPIFKEANETKKRYRIMKGSAGSGKSVDVAQDFILKLSSEKYRGASLLCVRKVEEANRKSTFPELRKAIYKIFGREADRHWTMRSQPLSLICNDTGNEVLFAGMKDDDQREKVKSITVAQGDITWIWIEEATELTETDVDTLDDRLRGKLSNPELYYQITMTFNPVSADHWIKSRYFDVRDKDVFTHHSTYKDNLFCDEAYKTRMKKMEKDNPEHYKVYGLGEWGLTGGQFFSEWSEARHVVKPFPIPQHWTRYRVMDWGSARPYAVYWFCVDFDDNIYVYRELYGYGGKPNVGTKESALEVAKKIVAMEKDKDKDMIYQGILDNACWTRTDPGYPSIAETINTELYNHGCRTFVPSVKGRTQCAEQMHLRLKGKEPKIKFFSNCHHAIRTIPLLVHDNNNPEMPNTNGEDHAYDAIAYGLMARPCSTEEELPKDEWSKEDDYGSNEETTTTSWGA